MSWRRQLKSASLVVVGSGIKSVAHLTIEAKAHIEQTQCVLYLVNEPVMVEWIERLNCAARSLTDLYYKFPVRRDCYQAITDYILQEVRKEQHVCVVIYGHPIVFAQPALDAVIQAKKEGYAASALPGISAEDCLFSDLLIDPGSCGLQSFEATDFLIRKRFCNVQSHLILWQVGVIGLAHHSKGFDNTRGATVLADYLSAYYALDHEVVLYEAASYPHEPPLIERMHLKDLRQAKYSPVSTLYIPPSERAPKDMAMLEALGMLSPSKDSFIIKH